MNEEGTVLDEAIENLKEAAGLLRPTHNTLWSASMDDHPKYRDLIHRVMTALAMAEAAFVEVRRRSTHYQWEGRPRRRP